MAVDFFSATVALCAYVLARPDNRTVAAEGMNANENELVIVSVVTDV